MGEDDGLLVVPSGRVGLRVGESEGETVGFTVPNETVGLIVGAKFCVGA